MNYCQFRYLEEQEKKKKNRQEKLPATKPDTLDHLSPISASIVTEYDKAERAITKNAQK